MREGEHSHVSVVLLILHAPRRDEPEVRLHPYYVLAELLSLSRPASADSVVRGLSEKEAVDLSFD